MMYTALIIDDEFRARQVLRKLCDQFLPQLQISGEASDIVSGGQAIQELRPDILFLDIEMPNGRGIELMQQELCAGLYVIVTTAHPQYAIEALRVKANDYLVKPIGISDLELALHRFQKNWARLSPPPESAAREESDLFSIPTQNGLTLVRVSDIVSCDSAGTYTVFHLENSRQLIATRNLKYFTQLLAAKGFYRIHHGHLINVAHLAEVNSRSNYCIMRNGNLVNVSQRKKSAFLRFLRHLGLG